MYKTLDIGKINLSYETAINYEIILIVINISEHNLEIRKFVINIMFSSCKYSSFVSLVCTPSRKLDTSNFIK